MERFIIFLLCVWRVRERLLFTWNGLKFVRQVESKTSQYEIVGKVIGVLSDKWQKHFTTNTALNFHGLYSRMRPANFAARVLTETKRFFFICHAIENTANQNTGKPLPLYVRRYYIQTSHHAPRASGFGCAVRCNFVAWYKIVINALSWYIMEYPTSHLHFLGIRIRLKACVYRENTSCSWDIPQNTTMEHCTTRRYIILS